MLNKTKIALAAALTLGAASTALASDDRNDRGGYVMPGSLDGVNPAYHPGIFGNPAVARSYGFVKSRNGTWQVQPGWQWGSRR
jgi:hypothetical protein